MSFTISIRHYTYIIHIIVEYENIAFGHRDTGDAFDIDFMKTKRQLMDEDGEKLMSDSTNVIFMEGRRLKMNL